MAIKRIVDIKLQPLSWRVLKEQYHYDGVAVDLGRGWLYNMLVQGLRRHPTITPWEVGRELQGLVEGKVYILDYDYQRYGGYLSLPRQANFSVAIYKRERERLCMLTATAHIMAGVSRDTAMKHFLYKAGYDDEEITFAALRKHYQRHFKHIEEDILQDLKELTIQK